MASIELEISHTHINYGDPTESCEETDKTKAEELDCPLTSMVLVLIMCALVIKSLRFSVAVIKDVRNRKVQPNNLVVLKRDAQEPVIEIIHSAESKALSPSLQL